MSSSDAGFMWQDQAAFKRAVRAAAEPYLSIITWDMLDGIIQAIYEQDPGQYGSGRLPNEEVVLVACALFRGLVKLDAQHEAAVVRCATGCVQPGSRVALLSSIATTIIAARADQVPSWANALVMAYTAAAELPAAPEQTHLMDIAVQANEGGAAELQDRLRAWNVSAELSAAPQLQRCTWPLFPPSPTGDRQWLATECQQPAIWHLWYRPRTATQRLVGNWVCPTCTQTLLSCRST